MPADMSKYPANWDEIRESILKWANNRCEHCGAENHQPHPETGSRVVLTIAHLDNPDPMDCRPENLAALCQRCHNRLDAPMRAQHAKVTRREKKAAAARSAGQLDLF